MITDDNVNNTTPELTVGVETDPAAAEALVPNIYEYQNLAPSAGGKRKRLEKSKKTMGGRKSNRKNKSNRKH